jgi:cbb3-type cytochrome oxidase cytochrome c subunit
LDKNQLAKGINRVGIISQTGDPQTIPGPDLGKVGLPSTHTVDWFKAYIRNPKKQKPKARMPSFEGKIREEDLTALAEYLASLK